MPPTRRGRSSARTRTPGRPRRQASPEYTEETTARGTQRQTSPAPSTEESRTLVTESRAQTRIANAATLDATRSTPAAFATPATTASNDLIADIDRLTRAVEQQVMNLRRLRADAIGNEQPTSGGASLPCAIGNEQPTSGEAILPRESSANAPITSASEKSVRRGDTRSSIVQRLLCNNQTRESTSKSSSFRSSPIASPQNVTLESPRTNNDALGNTVKSTLGLSPLFTVPNRPSASTEEFTHSVDPAQTPFLFTPVNAPKFVHYYDGTSDWDTFLALFEVNAASAGWSDREASLALVNALKGRALAEIRELPPTAILEGDYPLIRELLSKSFTAGNNSRTAKHQLMARRQLAGESLHEFAQAVGALAHAAFPNDRAYAQQEAADVFCAGLADRALARQMCMDDYPTLAAAEARAQRATYPDLKDSSGPVIDNKGNEGRLQRQAVRTVKCEPDDLPSAKRAHMDSDHKRASSPTTPSDSGMGVTTKDALLRNQLSQMADLTLAALRQATTTLSSQAATAAPQTASWQRSYSDQHGGPNRQKSTTGRRAWRRTTSTPSNQVGPTTTTSTRDTPLPKGCFRCRRKDHRIAECPFSDEQIPRWARYLPEEKFYRDFPIVTRAAISYVKTEAGNA